MVSAKECTKLAAPGFPARPDCMLTLLLAVLSPHCQLYNCCAPKLAVFPGVPAVSFLKLILPPAVRLITLVALAVNDAVCCEYTLTLVLAVVIVTFDGPAVVLVPDKLIPYMVSVLALLV